jgi:hypothetical protein
MISGWSSLQVMFIFSQGIMCQMHLPLTDYHTLFAWLISHGWKYCWLICCERNTVPWLISSCHVDKMHKLATRHLIRLQPTPISIVTVVQAVESYRLWPEGPGFESRSPHIAQVRVRLATNTLSQTPHRAGALCTGYARPQLDERSWGLKPSTD